MKLLADIAPRQMGRSMAASYTHELVLTFPHGDQVASGPAPPGYKPQVFDFTPIVINPGAATSSKAQRTADKQNSKSDVMQALRVVALGYRRSNRGDPASGTPPFAKIVVSACLHVLCSCSPACTPADPPECTRSGSPMHLSRAALHTIIPSGSTAV